MTFPSSNMYHNIDIDLHPRGPRSDIHRSGRSVVTSLSEACRINADVIEMYENLANEHKKATDELEMYKLLHQMRGTGPDNENEPVVPRVANRAIMDLNDRITALNLKITDTELEKRRLEQEIESLNGTIVVLMQEMKKMNGTMKELSKSRNREQEDMQQTQNEKDEEKKFIDLRKKYIEVNIKARDLENQKKIEEKKQSIAEILKLKKDHENWNGTSKVNNSEVTATQDINNSEVTATQDINNSEVTATQDVNNSEVTATQDVNNSEVTATQDVNNSEVTATQDVNNSEATATQRIGRFEVRQEASSTRVGGTTPSFSSVTMLHSELSLNKSCYLTWPSYTPLHARP